MNKKCNTAYEIMFEHVAVNFFKNDTFIFIIKYMTPKAPSFSEPVKKKNMFLSSFSTTVRCSPIPTQKL